MARIILRDGRVAEFRQAENSHEDIEAIRDLFRNVSSDSLYLRFFHLIRDVSDDFILQMIGDGGPNALALLCISGDRVIAVGNYVGTGAAKAEVAFLVADNVQGKGLGSLLLEHLAQMAWRHGFKSFEATVLRENYQMLKVFKDSGYELTSDQEPDSVHLILPLVETERTRALKGVREKLATAASLHRFFFPETVAVIGASRDANHLGHALLRRILEGGYKGTVYPVNPSTKSVSAIRAYSSVKDIPEAVDLAIISVPALQVLTVAKECMEAQVKGVLVVSAGFGDRDADGQVRQERLVQMLREAGCRLIGPNCLGLVNTNPESSLNASFAQRLPMPGSAAIASHSGALGITILEYADKIGLGVSSFVSLGNKADVSGNDMLQYWEDDPDTSMILLYLESFGNPGKFSSICRRIARHKPILAVKSARTQAGLAISNTRWTYPEPAEAVVDALFHQAGVIRANNLQEMFDVAALLGEGILPRGRRVAIVTNTAGGAVTTVDTLQREGLEFVPPVINLGYEALAEGYRDVLPQVLRDETVDAAIVLFTPIMVSDEEAVVDAISAAILEVASEVTETGAAAYPQKPVLANFLTHGDYTVRYVSAGHRRVPVYPFPEQAVHALAKTMRYAEFLQRDPGHLPDLPDTDTDRARDLVRTVMGTPENKDGSVPEAVCREILRAVGICSKPVEANRSESRLSASVTLQFSPLFGMVVELRSISQRLLAEWQASPFQHQAATQFGAQTRVVPLTDMDALEMVDSTFSAEPLPGGVRSHLSELLLRLSRLVEEVPEIGRIQLASIDVDSSGCVLSDIDFRLLKD